MKVFVGECSIDTISDRFKEAARRIGEYLGKEKYTYIQGNCIKGMMGITYNEYKKYHNDVEMYGLDSNEIIEKKTVLVDTFDKRTRMIMDNCDVPIFLPGADGTIQEIATFNQFNREYPSTHILILVNIDNFYKPLIDQYRYVIDCKLSNDNSFFDSFIVVNSIEEAINILENRKKA